MVKLYSHIHFKPRYVRIYSLFQVEHHFASVALLTFKMLHSWHLAFCHLWKKYKLKRKKISCIVSGYCWHTKRKQREKPVYEMLEMGQVHIFVLHSWHFGVVLFKQPELIEMWMQKQNMSTIIKLTYWHIIIVPGYNQFHMFYLRKKGCDTQQPFWVFCKKLTHCCSTNPFSHVKCTWCSRSTSKYSYGICVWQKLACSWLWCYYHH